MHPEMFKLAYASLQLSILLPQPPTPPYFSIYNSEHVICIYNVYTILITVLSSLSIFGHQYSPVCITYLSLTDFIELYFIFFES